MMASFGAQDTSVQQAITTVAGNARDERAQPSLVAVTAQLPRVDRRILGSNNGGGTLSLLA